MNELTSNYMKLEDINKQYQIIFSSHTLTKQSFSTSLTCTGNINIVIMVTGMAFHTIVWHQNHFAQFGIHRHEVTSHLQNSFTQIYKNFFKNNT